MFKHPFRLLGLVSVLVAVAFSQTTLDQQTANNTAACGNQGYCSASFTAMSDSNGVFNAAPGNVSQLGSRRRRMSTQLAATRVNQERKSRPR